MRFADFFLFGILMLVNLLPAADCEEEVALVYGFGAGRRSEN